MWVLVLIFFSGPMEISNVEVLEHHWTLKDCSKRVREAKSYDMPPDTNVGCINIKHISKA